MYAKNILVVGGSRGIGRSVVEHCLEQGANTIVVSRTEGDLQALADSSRLQHLKVDVLSDSIDPTGLPEVVDGFVFCPGSIQLGPIRATKSEVMREDFELNVVAALRCFQTVLANLKKSESASAVFFSSVAACQGLPMHTSVAASKGAIESLVRTWAAELSPKVRVNCVAPALTDTALAERFLSTEEKRQAMAAMYPLQRIGAPQDIANAVVHLLSPESSWMTGQVLRVDGGLSSVKK
ncbi:MAG: SDR family oxidoreductase [Pirellulaceae bacterium]|nr:SDR family oxidoreductase [Pirellulaceae bacterium]